jgi:hypothetical protein
MGVTTGALSGLESQKITITVPGTLPRDKADELAAALNELIEEFNDSHPGAKPALAVE